MSKILGHTEYYETAMKDDHLVRAHKKLLAQVVKVSDTGCCLVKPTGASGAPARFMVEGDHDLSRRWAWRIYCGPIPAGHRIYTTCGESECVAPAHLMAYRHEPPPRAPRRVVRPRAKLTWSIVQEMRALNEPSVSELAYLHDVHPSTIRAILSGKTWVNW
ncbi:hypothetical protein GCM10010149_89100 [Nonomuraea roseoviolacea subsp. roseoviolacea]|uniref:hypothetical protein n=1 Tax=Nonomuraea roseoviolacea TaxID=103837 RepID=UPI0031E48199